ncbi:DUF7507 domain-containing protein, partial [Polynucleobacter sinensis]|uniref:DUF7507 domain-containing protein n=1 Tax=Polynucleobacter sinensis TaxID=1743157 RepID=UPI00155E6A19
ISQTDFDAIGRSSDGDIDNTVVATASETLGSESVLSASEEVEVLLLPNLEISKNANATSIDSASDNIVYTISVENTGNTKLTGVTFTDP